ncbi:basic phospholipase A2 PA-5 [Lingula anatina]|uniref:Phospholipase A2 n=1 Tax=Lingula anatina TaxID=7574 RepID=A0A1S3HNR9_LINAN|nr:basic phospholipase A2 PA-5 [Lingula anatina]|eukprot:XP_013386679.1 basic phospholipase A2 PA-5 [Lingula anatina]
MKFYMLVAVILLIQGVEMSPKKKPKEWGQANSVVEFGSLVLCYTDSVTAFQLADYGCYCGYGGSGQTVDAMDECCKIHDKCLNTVGSCYTYYAFYSYTGCDGSGTDATCRPPSYYWFYGQCRYKLCQCDLEAAKCFKNALPSFNPRSYYNYNAQPNNVC